ncbi:MAG: LacI family DNA-binding transcriptional regulator [Planctomycetes bacterium]|nr:LacI family DNA-binding transcriptional regulator [Planctomycetota bacterium]
MKPVITQYDLAERLGVGQKTISRALAGEPRVAPELRARIIAAASALGYRPNQSARSVRSRRFDKVLFLQLAEAAHQRVDSGITDGIADGMAELGRSLVIERLVLPDFLTGGPAPRALREMMVDGVLVHGHIEAPRQVETMLTACRLPVVWVNRMVTHDCAFPDDLGGGRLMVERLVAAGHRRIAWYDGQLGFRPTSAVHHSRVQRRDGYRAAMRDADLAPRLFSPRHDPGRDGHLEWLIAAWGERRGADRPTAIACYGGHEALTVMVAAGRLGLRVPADLSLMVAHAEDLVAGIHLDVAQVPAEAMGRAAAALLGRRLDGTRRTPAVAVPFQHLPGASVATVG